MRLICPNCDAQYEVDDSAIPPAGRDVQCSSCGHAWFQRQADPDRAADPDLAPRAASTDPEAPASGWIDPDGAAEDDTLTDEQPSSGPVLPEDNTGPRRRGLDDSVLAVLREEAARETAVRRAEAPPPMEVQTDLGLAPPPPPPPTVPPSVLAARERFADLSAPPEELAPEDDIAVRPASRRELLPDIEEINSTLRASSEPRGDTAEAGTGASGDAERRGFRAGFVLIILIAVLMWSAYAMAPRIVAAVPAAETAVQAYVAAVDRARLAVDAALQSASRSLRSLSGLDRDGG